MIYKYHVVKYKIKDGSNSNSYQQVQEIDSNGFFLTWAINELKDKDTVILNTSYESFKRTREWTLENHPELLL